MKKNAMTRQWKQGDSPKFQKRRGTERDEKHLIVKNVLIPNKRYQNDTVKYKQILKVLKGDVTKPGGVT